MNRLDSAADHLRQEFGGVIGWEELHEDTKKLWRLKVRMIGRNLLSGDGYVDSDRVLRDRCAELGIVWKNKHYD